MISLTKTIPKPQRLSVDSMTGDLNQIMEQLVDSTDVLVDAAISPLKTAYNTIQAMVKTADTSYNAAVTAYKTSLILSRKESSRLKKVAESSLTFRDRLNSFLTRLDEYMFLVNGYASHIKEIIRNKSRHSIEWMGRKINQLLDKINKVIYNGLSLIDKKMTALESSVTSRANDIQNKLTDRGKEIADSELSQLQNNQKLNRHRDSRVEELLK